MCEEWGVGSGEWGRMKREKRTQEERFKKAETLYDKDKCKKAFPLFQALAHEGYVPAQVYMGACYLHGKGIPEDRTKAAEWFHKAAEQGDAEAQQYLGLCYFNGFGVTENYETAAEWYRKSAEQGNVHSQNLLGICFYKGEGVPQNYEAAAQWFRKAVSQGDISGGIWLDNLKREGLI